MSDQTNFEQSMTALADIVKQLEKGDLPLEECLKLYEHGILLAGLCKNVLTQAEQKMEVLQHQAPSEAGDE